MATNTAVRPNPNIRVDVTSFPVAGSGHLAIHDYSPLSLIYSKSRALRADYTTIRWYRVSIEKRGEPMRRYEIEILQLLTQAFNWTGGWVWTYRAKARIPRFSREPQTSR